MKKIIASASALLLATSCTSQPVSRGSSGATAPSRPQGTLQPPPLPAMPQNALPVPGKTPVAVADANPAAEQYSCHDRPNPAPYGISVVNGFGREIQGRVDIHCDSVALMPYFQQTEMTLYLITSTSTTRKGFASVLDLPGLGTPHSFLVDAGCEVGTWVFAYAMTGLSNEGQFAYGPINLYDNVTSC